MVVAKIKFIDIALKMLLANMMESAIQAAFEKGKTTLDGVRRDDASDIFFEAVIDRFVARNCSLALAAR